MDSPKTRRRVLVVGLDPHRVPGPWDPAPVVAAIEAGLTGLAEGGYAAASCLVGLDGTDDIEGRIRDSLRDGPWDCVLVGGGIRKDDGLLELFETVVNLVHRHAPAATIAFNDSPHDLVEAVTRSLALGE